MKGTVTAVEINRDEHGTDGRYVAAVTLDGETEPRAVAYWPELLEQWGPEKLRAHLVDQAAQAQAAERAHEQAVTAAAAHADALAGNADTADAPGETPAEPATLAP